MVNQQNPYNIFKSKKEKVWGMKRQELILNYLKEMIGQFPQGLSAGEIAGSLGLERANVSRELNEAVRKGILGKSSGRPVRYFYLAASEQQKNRMGATDAFQGLIGAEQSLEQAVLQAKAAILYPPQGLHCLLIGPTGVGKTQFAETMYRFALEKGVLPLTAPFVSFNCADYAHNPQLLLGVLFGVKKGAYTGAERDQEGLVAKAHGGILFLDEIHRLPAEGQEMLFYLLDKGRYRPLGETGEYREARVLLLGATTENPQSQLLSTFCRRIPMLIELPPLGERTREERLSLIRSFLEEEARRMRQTLEITEEAVMALALYEPRGNIGQLKSDIQLACAKAFLHFVTDGEERVKVEIGDLPVTVRQSLAEKSEQGRQLRSLLLAQPAWIFEPEAKQNGLVLSAEPIQEPDFYQLISKRVKSLAARKLSEQEIQQILYNDIERYFQRLLAGLPEKIDQIIPSQYLEKISFLVAEAELALGRTLPARVYYGIAMHLTTTIEHIKNGKSMPKTPIGTWVEEYPDELKAAEQIIAALEQEMGLKFPDEEAALVALFLASERKQEEKNQSGQPGIVVLCHGRATASSMAEVAAELLGFQGILTLDMPLTMSPEEALEQATELVRKADQGLGVVLLVDMGSFLAFGEIISERTGIVTEVVEGVNTMLVMQALRLVQKEKLTARTLAARLRKREQPGRQTNKIVVSGSGHKRLEGVILVTCSTGEGSALKIKALLEEKLPELAERNINLLPVGPHNLQVPAGKQILAVVGSFPLPELQVPFISIDRILTAAGLSQLRWLINGGEQLNWLEAGSQDRQQLLAKMEETLAKHLRFINPLRALPLVIDCLSRYEREMGRQLPDGNWVGLIMHIVCMLERKIQNRLNLQEDEVSGSQMEHPFLQLFQPVLAEFDVKLTAREKANLLHLLEQALRQKEEK